jgi:hypothetical protein
VKLSEEGSWEEPLHHYPFNLFPPLECHISPLLAVINGCPRLANLDLDAIPSTYHREESLLDSYSLSVLKLPKPFILIYNHCICILLINTNLLVYIYYIFYGGAKGISEKRCAHCQRQ